MHGMYVCMYMHFFYIDKKNVYATQETQDYKLQEKDGLHN